MNFETGDLKTFRAVVQGAVVLGWIVFAVMFWLRKRPAQAATKETRHRSGLGILLQGISFGLVWGLRRPSFSPFVPIPGQAEIALGIFTVGLMAASVWLSLTAVRTLGKEWSFEARLVEGHRLVTQGPYRIVRNPIYSGMLGKLVATGLAMSHWLVVLAAVSLFLVGTAIRVRSEEALLRGAFGKEFDEYARRVPTLIPGLW